MKHKTLRQPPFTQRIKLGFIMCVMYPVLVLHIRILIVINNGLPLLLYGTLVIPASCPSTLPQPPKSLDDHTNCRKSLFRLIFAVFPGTRPGNQLMQPEKLLAATGQHEAQTSSANSHTNLSRSIYPELYLEADGHN